MKRDDAFEAAFPGLYRRALAVAARIVGPGDAADDVAAEALARTFVNWRKVRDLPYLEAWVRRVAANVALDTVRKRRVPIAPEALRADVADGVIDRMFVAGAIASLSRRQREVVVLRYVADLSEAEVASLLGVGIETVKEHARRAMTALRAGGDEQEVGNALV